MSEPHAFDLAVLIGRFQPFHQGHAALLERALAAAPRVVVVLGSARQARNAKNPFTWEERAAMIAGCLDAATAARLAFVPVRDYYDDGRWAAAVKRAVHAAGGEGGRVALVGHAKDATSAYLGRFPGWSLLPAPPCGEIDASAVRRVYFEGDNPAALRALLAGLLPAPVAHYLEGWGKLPHYARLRDEHRVLAEYRQRWGAGPFVTVDAVVIAAGHVLLVRRGNAPGRGLWAVPGGFLEGRERVLQGAIRELREETGLGVLDSLLEASLKGVAVFDHPDRSQRGRIVTHAHHFDLGDCRLPAVAGADDAAEARWVAVGELAGMEEEFFEDHFCILDHFLGIAG